MAAMLASTAQAQPSAGELLRDIEHLRVVGSVLYVAAHPDDENTRLLAWMVGERGLDATYLSMTRGGGGQNLVGTEQADRLGVVRTGELLAARSIDGADQRFARTRDFGYSKSAEEALSSWGHDEALHDVVRVVRELQPDVMITRFGATDVSHGHHVASAVLANEAFERAADPAFTTAKQEPWQADRILRNQSHWRIKADTDTSSWLSVDVGGYDPLSGQSWGEVAAHSRTQHKSQGFGSAPSVGPQLEYFSGVAGNVPEVGDDLFAGLDFTWNRFGAKAVDKALAKAIKAFDPKQPNAVLPHLAKAHALLDDVDAGPWGPRKQRDLEEVMAAATGLWLKARVDQPAVTPGSSFEIEATALSRGGASVELHGVTVGKDKLTGVTLAPHTPWSEALTYTLPSTANYTVPHWLESPPSPTLYDTPEGPQRTAADTAPSLQAVFDVSIAGRRMQFREPVEFAWTDRVMGERSHPVEVLPPVTASFGQRTRLVEAGQPMQAVVTLRAEAGESEGTLILTAPEGTSVVPSRVRFSLGPDAPEQLVPIEVSAGDEPGALSAEVVIGGKSYRLSSTVIDHPHLPRRTLLEPAELQLVPVQLNRGPTSRIAYLPGSGDQVDTALRDLGYEVELLSVEALQAGALSDHKVLVLGIRAFNAVPGLPELKGVLLDWVSAGGRLVVQYNTSTSRRPLAEIGPAPLTIRRDRVTDQTAKVTFIDPKAPILTTPNALTEADFEGWVQERGLYFAESWDEAYTPVFRMNDPGEEPLEGSLLVAQHGEGQFIYTGISFFRQLPAGVPGAARLLANLLATEEQP